MLIFQPRRSSLPVSREVGFVFNPFGLGLFGVVWDVLPFLLGFLPALCQFQSTNCSLKMGIVEETKGKLVGFIFMIILVVPNIKKYLGFTK